MEKENMSLESLAGNENSDELNSSLDARENVTDNLNNIVKIIEQTNTKNQILKENFKLTKAELDKFKGDYDKLLRHLSLSQKQFKSKLKFKDLEKERILNSYKKLSAAYVQKEAELKGEISNKEASLVKLIKEKESELKDIIGSKEKSLALAVKRIKELEGSLKFVNADYEKQFNQLKSFYKNKEKNSLHQIAGKTQGESALKNKISELELKLEESNKKLESAEEEVRKEKIKNIENIEKSSLEVKEARRKYFEVEGKFNTAIDESIKKNNLIKSLDKKFETLKIKFSSYMSALDVKNEENLKLHKRNAELEEESKTATNKAEDYLLELKNLKERFTFKSKELESALRESKEAKDAKDKNLAAIRENYFDKERTKFLDKLNDLKMKLVASEFEIEGLKEYKRTSLKEKKEISNERDNFEVLFNKTKEEFKNFKREYEFEIKSLSKDSIRKKQVLESLKQEIETKTDQLVIQKNATKSVLKRFRKFNFEKDGLDNKIEYFQEQNQKLRDSLNLYKLKARKLKNSVYNKNEQISLFEKEMAELKASTTRAISERDNLKTELLDSFKLTKKLEQKIDVLNSEILHLNKQSNSLNLDLVSLNKEKDNLEVRFKILNKEYEVEKSQNTLIKKQLLDQSEILSSSNIKVEEYKTKEGLWLRVQDSLESKINDLKVQLSERNTEITKKQEMICEYQSLQQNFEIEEEKLNSLIKEFDSKINAYEAESKKQQAQLDDYKVKNTKLEHLNNSNIDLISSHETSLEKLKNLNQAKEARIEGLFKVIKEKETALEDQELAYREEISLIKEKKAAIEDQLKSKVNLLNYASKESKAFNDNLKERDHLLQKKSELILELNKKVDRLINEKRQLNERLKDNLKGVDSLKETIDNQLQEVDEYKSRLNKQIMVSKRLEIREEDLLKQTEGISLLHKKIDDLESEKSRIELKLSERHKQLDFYSRWVDSQKEGLQKHIIRFTQDLKTSIAINPLRSYLAMTEKEIVKTQVVLSKPGVSGSQREHIESHYGALHEQKQFIIKLLEKTEKDVDKKINDALGLLKQGELIPVPPLPPEIKI